MTDYPPRRRIRLKPVPPAKIPQNVTSLHKPARKGTAKIPKDVARSLETTVKRYGTRAVFRGSSKVTPVRIPTGIFVLDYALLGGIPQNTSTMILGEKHAGKSLLTFKTIANAQMLYPDEVCVVVDTEHSWDAVWAAKLGVDPDRVFVVEPETGEQAVDQANLFALTEDVSLVVIDSIASLVPMKEIDSSAETAHVGLQSRLIASMMRRLTHAMIHSRSNGKGVTLLYVNQFRSKIGGFVMGDPRTPAGGKYPEYHVGLSITMKNKENKAGGGLSEGHIHENVHSFSITKNKYNNGPRTGEFVLAREADPTTGVYEGMINDADTLIAYAKKKGLYTGRKPNIRLQVGKSELNFTDSLEAVAALRADEALHWRLRSQLIRDEAERWGMPEAFLRTVGMRDYSSLQQ